MYGINFPDFLRFIIQLSAAVAGAASLWGLVFVVKGKRSPEFAKLSRFLFLLFLVSVVVFLISWWFGNLTIFSPEAVAHEGIRLHPEEGYISRGFSSGTLPVIVLTIVSLLNLFLYVSRPKQWIKESLPLWLVQFVSLATIISFSSVVGDMGRTIHQVFFVFHNAHSIFTVGTVIVIDYLFITVLIQQSLKKALYNFFPIMSAVIWIGLGFDFLSNFLVFKEAFKVTEQFLFSQTVVGIIIINGALLSGKINELLIGSTKEGAKPFDASTQRILGVSGAISIVSWLSITFVDFFVLTVDYTTLLIFYALLIISAYFAHRISENLIKASRIGN